jgi:AbrB family looped-hinge helix DNA binding protein
MAQATISPTFQIAIPEEIRNEIPLTSGQTVQVLAKNGVITLVPDHPLSSLRGYLKGIGTEGFREKNDRL